jgi:hypothetical protein
VFVTYAISVTSDERVSARLTPESHFGATAAFSAIRLNWIDFRSTSRACQRLFPKGLKRIPTGNRRTLLLSLGLPNGVLTLASSRSVSRRLFLQVKTGYDAH